MARVLWIGDAGSHTGFGRVTRELTTGLLDRGHDITVLGLNFTGDYDPDIDQRLKVYRADLYGYNDMFGVRRVQEMVDHVEPDVSVVMHDPAAVWQYLWENPYDPGQRLFSRPVLAYCPVDGYDYPTDWTEMLPQATNFVTMSQHGASIFKPSAVVPHGVRSEFFYPVAEGELLTDDGQVLGSKEECKEHLGIDPSRFLVLRVDANSGRKDFAATIRAVAPLLERQRDMTMWLHTNTDPRSPGVKIRSMLNRYDLAPTQVMLSDFGNGTKGWPENRLRILYNAADVFVSTSRGEGFGLTIAEAMACGVPVIAQNVSAIPETVGPGGVLIDSDRRITVPAGQDLCLADIDAFTEALERLYTNEVWRTELGQAGRKHVTESFRWDTAVDSFHDFIERIAARWRASQEAPTDGSERADLPDEGAGG
ncbi:MAG TPA: glycosyltransferase family 4 protein [Actinomycetes bacterium]|nr:glycosyltransferase family 4 protein [Actinomycetes bacterium]